MLLQAAQEPTRPDRQIWREGCGPGQALWGAIRRRPVTLVHAEVYERIDEVIAAERRIKGWSWAKKEAYIRGDFDALTDLSRRRSKSEP